MELTITAIFLVIWFGLGYILLRQLSLTHKVILVCAIAITALLFYHDSVYDKCATPYTLAGHLQEIMLTGSIYILIIFFLIEGIRLAIHTSHK